MRARDLCDHCKGGKVVTVPLAPRTAPTIGLVNAEPCTGLAFLAADDCWLDRHGAAWIVCQVARLSRIAKPVGLHALRRVSFVVSLRDHDIKWVSR